MLLYALAERTAKALKKPKGDPTFEQGERPPHLHRLIHLPLPIAKSFDCPLKMVWHDNTRVTPPTNHGCSSPLTLSEWKLPLPHPPA